MLPITSPFDTYRAGLWAVQQNIRLFAGYLVLMTAINFLGSAIDTERVFLSIGAGAAILLSLVLLVGVCMIPAVLIYPLHATFLSDGRNKGLAAIESFDRLCRIGWRLFVIVFLALIPTLIVIVPAILVLFPGMMEIDATVAESGTGQEAEAAFNWSVIALFGVLGLFSGVSVILFGPHIPDIVTKNDGKPGPSSFQRGTRYFWRMAANLAAGPGLVLLAYYALWWLVVASPAEETDRSPFEPIMLLSDFVGLCVSAFCSAMIAGVLSDAYRRALAQEAQSRAA